MSRNTPAHRALLLTLVFAATSLLLSCHDERSASPIMLPDADMMSTDDTNLDDARQTDLQEDLQEADLPDDGDSEDNAETPDAPGAEDSSTSPEICDNQIDDDLDGMIDCDDQDCPQTCGSACGPACEICNDLIDNDEDGNIDCQDPDCAFDPLCPERCQNEEDDDGDGNVDCDDSECAFTSRCRDDPMPVETYTFRDMAYFHRIQYPPPGVECCFDYNGIPGVDNRMTQIIGAIPGYEPQANMDAIINSGDVAVLLEWREAPDLEEDGPATFYLYRGAPVDPEPSLRPVTNPWNDGNGTFQVLAESFDRLGPRIRFDQNEIDDRFLRSANHQLNLTFPIAELGLNLDLTLYEAKVEMHLAELVRDDRSFLTTVPQTVDTSQGAVVTGGGKLGGIIRADDIFSFINEGAQQCGCARPAQAQGPLFTFGERSLPTLSYVASCNWIPLEYGDADYTCTFADDGQLCPNLQQVCGVLGLSLPALLDVDYNKNQINESVSVGLFFDLTGAKLAEPPVR